MPMMPFTIIAAVDDDGGIGKNNTLPWEHKDDLRFFERTTKGHAVIMGRKTWESLPKRPLKERLNIVLTRTGHDREAYEGAYPVSNLDSALILAQQLNSKKCFVMGGAQVYGEALQHPLLLRGIISRIPGRYACDTLFPVVDGDTNNEQEYLRLVRHVLDKGECKPDRTGVGTLSVFGWQMRFDLSKGFPLLTTKFVSLRNVALELFWFLSGSTDSTLLEKQGVNIWRSNTTEEEMKRKGLEYRRGDIGPGYGFQWRHFGANYKGCDQDYTGQGMDQVAELIRGLKTNPHSRRHILSGWNPTDLGLMVLPPCHTLMQFYVHADGRLSCQLYQRSGDIGLGVPYNVASYSLLTYLIAHVCGLKPGHFVHTLGDAHIYLDHVAVLQQQVERTPHPSPTLDIRCEPKEDPGEYTWQDLKLKRYLHHPPLPPMKMAV